MKSFITFTCLQFFDWYIHYLFICQTKDQMIAYIHILEKQEVKTISQGHEMIRNNHYSYR